MKHLPGSITPFTHLVPLAEQRQLGDRLYELVRDPQTTELLRTRRLLGVLARHGAGREVSKENVVKYRTLQHREQLGAFVIKTATNEIAGTAIANPSARLMRQRLSVPPFLARGVLRSELHMTGPKITAWTAPHLDPHSKLLSETYAALSERFDASWAVEPTESPFEVQAAILEAGYAMGQQPGYYDDGESRRNSPPQSYLYQK